jgi:hypothetical protein
MEETKLSKEVEDAFAVVSAVCGAASLPWQNHVKVREGLMLIKSEMLIAASLKGNLVSEAVEAEEVSAQ